MPFQISTSASRGPCRPIISDHDGAREHEVAAGLADHLVAVARQPTGGWPCAYDVRMRDVDAGLGPQPGDGGGVHLGAAGLDVVEVAPGQHVDAAEAGRGGEVADLRDARPGAVGRGGRVGRRRTTTSRVVGHQ